MNVSEEDSYRDSFDYSSDHDMSEVGSNSSPNPGGFGSSNHYTAPPGSNNPLFNPWNNHHGEANLFHHMQAAHERYRSQDYTTSLAQLDACQAIAKGNTNTMADIHILKGDNYRKLHKYNKAIQEYELASTKTAAEKLALCYDRLAIIHRKTGSYQQAFKLICEADRILSGIAFPTADTTRLSAQVLKHLASIYLQQNMAQKAIEILDQSLAKCYDNFALNNKGLAYLWLGELDKAYKILAKVVSRDPNSYVFNNSFGLVMFKCKDHQKAIELFQKSLSINPTYTKALNNIGWTYLDLEYPDEAITYFKQALEKGGSSLDLYCGMGKSCLLKKDYSNAVVNFNHCLTLRPTDTQALVFRGDAYFALNKIHHAIRDYKEAYKCDNTCLPAYTRLTEIAEVHNMKKDKNCCIQ